MHLDNRIVAVWYPTSAKPAKYSYNVLFSGEVAVNGAVTGVCGKPVPLVVFSHGDFGCGLQSIAFTEELARNGYVVAAPDHADAFYCHVAPPASHHGRPTQPNFFKPNEWTDATFIDRRKDVEAVIDGLLADRDFGPAINGRQIGAAGHSLGGYTVVGMAGGWSTWVDPRVRAVLALSPYVMPFLVQKSLGSVHVPLMYQGGTLDIGITPFLSGPLGAYRAANPPAYFVELKHAGHLAWASCGSARTTAACLSDHISLRLIDDYGIAFFNRYLKGTPQPILERENSALAKFDFNLGK
jgi:predicted dienelactone hydrolase